MYGNGMEHPVLVCVWLLLLSIISVIDTYVSCINWFLLISVINAQIDHNLSVLVF